MIQGIGCDIIEIERISQTITRHGQPFLNKLFTIDEQNYCNRFKNPFPYFAGHFCAKEAIVKALGTGFQQGITWLDLEIQHNALGKPIAKLSSNLLIQFNSPQILLSISHCHHYAMATALLL